MTYTVITVILQKEKKEKMREGEMSEKEVSHCKEFKQKIVLIRSFFSIFKKSSVKRLTESTSQNLLNTTSTVGTVHPLLTIAYG